MKHRCVLLLICALLMPCQSALAQSGNKPVEQPTSVASPPPEDLRQFIGLLQRPDIQAWLRSQAGNRSVEEQSSAEAANAREIIVGQLNAARSFVHAMATAIPTLPAELNQARVALMTEMRGQGSFAAILPLVFFATLGFGLEWLYRRATTGFRNRTIAIHLDTVDDRLHAAGLRILYGLGVLLAFAVGSIGAFLLFDWPPLLQHTVLAYLLVFLAVRLTLIVGRIVLAPGAERFRLMPMATVTARGFWFVWSAVLVGFFAFGHFTYQLLPMLGVGREKPLHRCTCIGFDPVWSGPLCTLALSNIRRCRFGREPPTPRRHGACYTLYRRQLVGRVLRRCRHLLHWGRASGFADCDFLRKAFDRPHYASAGARWQRMKVFLRSPA